MAAMHRIAPLLLLAALCSAEGWHRQRKEGEEASRKSGKPLLVVTMWGEKT